MLILFLRGLIRKVVFDIGWQEMQQDILMASITGYIDVIGSLFCPLDFVNDLLLV